MLAPDQDKILAQVRLESVSHQQASQAEMEKIKLVLTKLSTTVSAVLNTSTASGQVPTASDPGGWRVEFNRLARNNADMELVIARLLADQKSMTEQITKLKENQVEAIHDAQRTLLSEFASTTDAQATTNELTDALRADMYSLRISVEALRIEGTRGFASGEDQTATIGGAALDSDDVKVIKSNIAKLVDQVSVLEKNTDDLKSKLITDTVVFGKHRFETEGSYDAFVLEHFPKNYYGYCVDFISMLELGTHQNRSTREALQNMKTSTGAGFVNPYEGVIWGSFGTFFPSLFGIENDVKDPCKKMGSMTDSKEWDPKSSRAGRKNNIDNSMTAVRRVLETQIGSNHKLSETAKDFFFSLVSATCSFWESFVSWITKFENEMCSLTPGDNPEVHKTQIWNLICWMIHSMLVEMAARRAAGNGASSMETDENKFEIASSILQGTMGAHKFMRELRDHDFGKHPIFASTMVEFLITTKAPYLAVEDLRNTVKRIDTTTRMLQGNKDRKGKDS